MLSKFTIGQIIDSQKERLDQMDTSLKREISDIRSPARHAIIITGIRRCGKSTLLQQINNTFTEPTLYLNFEDPRLTGFDTNDFNRLQEIIVSRGINVLFFDEIQNVSRWENYIRFRLDEGYRIFITGSNASMISRELGTKLTGRHLPVELFPFSYNEYLSFTKKSPDLKSEDGYLTRGGFPEMLRTDMPEVLMNTFNDILFRDIALRYSIKNTTAIKQLAVWLLSNTGKPVTGNSLRKMFSVGSSSSIMEYLSYLSDTYLFFFVPRFSYSQKVQIVNPRKVYSVDNGLAEANSLSFSSDYGRLLENMVFMHLRRMKKDIFYFKEQKECDFVISEKGKVTALYQVSWQLDQDNTDRELAGLSEAMEFFKLKEGTVITHDQSDSFTLGRQKIRVLPFYRWAEGQEGSEDK